MLSDAPEPPRTPPPTLLGPWLATGFGLALLIVIPNDGATDVAGAAPVSAGPVGQTAPAFASFQNSLDQLTPLPDVATADHSPAAMLTMDAVQAPAGSEHPPNTAYPFQVNGTPVRELPPGYSHPLVDPGAAIGLRPDPSPEQWAQLRFCESSGNYAAVNATGRYRGAYQFDVPTWESVGGAGDPAAAAPEEQDLRAARLYRERGSSPWPFCGQYLDTPVD